MFKIKLFVFATIFIAIAIYSCKKNELVNFANPTIKTMLDNNCKSCHASGANNARDWLYNASDYNSSIKNNINTLYHEVYIRQKPRPGKNLTATDLANFKAWYDAGYPAN